MSELPSRSVDLIVADPPYDLSDEEKTTYQDAMRRVARGAIIVFCPPENQWVGRPDQYLFWVKPLSTKNTTKSYSRFVEMILVYGSGAWDRSYHWSNYVNVFTDYCVAETAHPFEKPVSLIERLIRNHSRPGGIVLDPFAGSGTTCLAAARLGRKWIGVERDAGHVAARVRLRAASPPGVSVLRH